MPVSVGLQKNSPLKPKIDSYLSRVVEAGLVIKWLNDVMFKIRTTEAKQDKLEIKALMNLSKLYGAFAALLAGYVVSIIVLILEVFMWFCVEKRRPDFDKYNMQGYYHRDKKKKIGH